MLCLSYDTASVSSMHAIAAAREGVEKRIREEGMSGRPDLPLLRVRSGERRGGGEGRSLCDWSSDVCSSDLSVSSMHAIAAAREGVEKRIREEGMSGRPDLPLLRV